MKRLLSLFALAATSLPLLAQNPPARPPITGIARVRLYSSDLAKSRDFYKQILGFAPGTSGCTGKTQPCFTINDHQQVELVQITSGTPENLLAEVAFATPDLSAMRAYLTAHHVNTSAIAKDSDGVQHFEFTDPESHPLAFVQLPSSRFFSPTQNQVSTRLVHAGFIVKDRALADHFYMDTLGFRLYWHGGFKDVDRSAVASENENDWWEIQVPDGSDWIEYMLNIPANADHKERGVQNHFSLAGEKIHPLVARLRANGLKSTDQPEVGRDGKWQYDAFDPDDTRVEFMEFTPTKQPCCNAYTSPHPKP